MKFQMFKYKLKLAMVIFSISQQKPPILFDLGTILFGTTSAMFIVLYLSWKNGFLIHGQTIAAVFTWPYGL